MMRGRPSPSLLPRRVSYVNGKRKEIILLHGEVCFLLTYPLMGDPEMEARNGKWEIAGGVWRFPSIALGQ